MKLIVSKSKNAASLYVAKSVYKNGVRSSKIVENLGTEKELREKLGGQDPYAWAKEYVDKLTQQEKENSRKVIVTYSPVKQIPLDVTRSYHGGYLFLQKIYYQLKLPDICKDISNRYQFKYDLNSILSRLVYGRVLFPASKKATCELTKDFIQPHSFNKHQVYRALGVIAKESDYIQSQLYKNSIQVFPRNTRVLFYDCTNFYFEIEQEEGLKQYGKGKENRPNPIVQMGLFIDGNGIPLALSITKGNTNEQVTLKPLEQKILSDFNLAEFIVCTDAGLSSTANRKFNNKGKRSFITTQSIKKLKKHLKEWALDPSGWKISGSKELTPSGHQKPATYNISALLHYPETPEQDGGPANEEELDAYQAKRNQMKALTFYKERWIKEDGLEQKLIVTFSLKYCDYQRLIRQRQIERAQKLMETAPGKIKKKSQNDYRRFVNQQACTKEGEAAKHVFYELNETLIQEEMMYDGFYAVCTNLEEPVDKVIGINKDRWEIEESFRIMKSEFDARPVYVSRDDCIEAHFITCFLALMVYRLLEKTLNKELDGKKDNDTENYTCPEIIQTLRTMDFYKIEHEGYVPLYQRTALTDALHDTFGFRTDYEIVNEQTMKKIKKFTTT